MSRHNTKFSHQLFAQYFVSAIIPVMILALLSFYTVTGLLKKNAERQIYAESRAVGLTLYDRLLAAESNLLNISASIIKEEFTGVNEWERRMFSSLYIQNRDKDKEVIIGKPVFEYALNKEQKDHLQQKKQLLLIKNTENNSGQLYMLNILDNVDQRLLIAELNPEYLWNITTKEDDLFCVTVNKVTLLYCPGLMYQSDSLSKLRNYLASYTESSQQDVAMGGEIYLGNIWDLFLESSFNVEALSVIYFMPKKNAFIEYEYYKDALPLSISITLLLVFIFSSVQMRRSLLPLNSLIHGAKNIIADDFTKTVDIKSNDEFEILGKTFNEMAHRIDEQIKKIKTLAKIDRLILSTLDTENIVEVLKAAL